MKSAVVIIARTKEWLKVSLSPYSNDDNNDNNNSAYKFVVLVITDAYAMQSDKKFTRDEQYDRYSL